MLSVFGFDFHYGLYLCNFSVFLSFYFCQVPFLENYSAIEFFISIDLITAT